MDEKKDFGEFAKPNKKYYSDVKARVLENIEAAKQGMMNASGALEQDEKLLEFVNYKLSEFKDEVDLIVDEVSKDA